MAPPGDVEFIGGKLTVGMGEPGSGKDVAWWIYEDLQRPLMRLDAAVGYDRDEVDLRLVSYDEMRPGAFSVKERLEDMDANWIESSLCFPTFPRFCGQTFLEAKDKDVALACVKAYNDWMVEEWCADPSGRLIPLIIVPLWDATLAGEEVRRNAARGVRAVCFTEIPPFLGLPSVHDPNNYWDPFFGACAETGTVINMHIGSSSKMPSTSADAPAAVGSTLTFANSGYSLVDWLMSGTLHPLPRAADRLLRGLRSAGSPTCCHRADTVWEENRGWGGVADMVKRAAERALPRATSTAASSTTRTASRRSTRSASTASTYESDYPHSDSTWPKTRHIAEEQMKDLDRDDRREDRPRQRDHDAPAHPRRSLGALSDHGNAANQLQYKGKARFHARLPDPWWHARRRHR